jgi:hypothetical protein
MSLKFFQPRSCFSFTILLPSNLGVYAVFYRKSIGTYRNKLSMYELNVHSRAAFGFVQKIHAAIPIAFQHQFKILAAVLLLTGLCTISGQLDQPLLGDWKHSWNTLHDRPETTTTMCLWTLDAVFNLLRELDTTWRAFHVADIPYDSLVPTVQEDVKVVLVRVWVLLSVEGNLQQ